MSLSPPVWSLEQLTAGAAVGIEAFRDNRVNEAREDYTSHYEEALGAVEDLLEGTTDLRTLPADARGMIEIPAYLEAFRYLSAPPMSQDDLETLSGVSAKHFATPNGWPSVVTWIQETIDAHRFPWVREDRDPTPTEREIAAVATAVQIAARRIMTSRANEAKKAQEELVKTALREAGFIEVAPRKIASLHGAPQPGEFCGESELGGSKADVIARLPDFRTLCIECKVSNSAVNSYKRVNHEAANKAKNWIQKFGTEEIVPAAVIAGVYSPKALAKAQQLGLTLWWSHDVDQMVNWIQSIQPAK